MNMVHQGIIWQAKPSQIINLPLYILCGLLLPIPWAIYVFLRTATTTYLLTDERLVEKSGILNRKTEEIELYRIKDYQLLSPLLYRIFGLSKIRLLTSDKTAPVFILKGIDDGEIVKEYIRSRVEFQRKQKGVREFD